MADHVHTGIEEVVFITLAALVGFTALRLIATYTGQKGGAVGAFGTGLGGALRFGN